MANSKELVLAIRSEVHASREGRLERRWSETLAVGVGTPWSARLAAQPRLLALRAAAPRETRKELQCRTAPSGLTSA